MNNQLMSEEKWKMPFFIGAEGDISNCCKKCKNSAMHNYTKYIREISKFLH